MDGRCPAEIKCKIESNGKISVIFIETHVGHKMELKHINLPEADRDDIKQSLIVGLSRDVILQKIRSTLTENLLSKKHLIRKSDLYHIQRSLGILNPERRHKSDPISVEAWIEEMKNSDLNEILIYKPQGERIEDYSGSNADFILCLMKPYQKFMLEKYGNKCITIDSTHGTNNYDFQLTTIMIIDENK